MPFPAGTPTVTLVGTLPSAVAGDGYGGQVVLTPSAILTDETRHAIYPGGGKTAIVDGTFSVQVIPTSAPGIEPAGWRWQVDIRPAGGRRLTFWADIPGSDGATIHLDDLVPAQAPGGGSVNADGKSAYDLAVAQGFEGSVIEWLASLVGPQGLHGDDGTPGASAYELALANGYAGTEAEWLASLVGPKGDDGDDATNLVVSVNDKQGVVTLGPADVEADPAGAAAAAQTAAAADATAKVSAHSSDTTDVHGIADTTKVVTTDDARLTNARTPTTHAASHATAGSDPVTPAAIGAYPAADGNALNTLVTDLQNRVGGTFGLESRATVLESRASTLEGSVAGKIDKTGGTLAGTFTNNVTATTVTAYGGGVAGDLFDRWRTLGNGTQQLGPGTATRDTSWGRQGVAQIGTADSDVVIGLAGKGLRIKEGTGAKMGVATLVAGTVTVPTTAVAATSRILLTTQTPGGTPGWLHVSARTAGTNFTILSSSAADTSVIAWLIVDPA
ncbi:hypothetical protein ACFUJU_13525 [Streptomyces sp. NPDC057235]|uniref:hypothetical protein n=1 Tax=Streptomyces sp. NPDC057235 TaxID=3346058 RepID=UPI00363BA3F0